MEVRTETEEAMVFVDIGDIEKEEKGEEWYRQERRARQNEEEARAVATHTHSVYLQHARTHKHTQPPSLHHHHHHHHNHHLLILSNLLGAAP
jgi:hypothetical protein